MTVEYRRCAGVALITVLFILVLMTTFVVYMVDDEHIALRRISNQREAEGSYQLAVASEQWAVKVLERDLELDEKPGPKNDHLNEAWTKLEPLADFKDESGNVYASMKTFLNDETGKFNLNNLLASSPSTAGGTETPTPPSDTGGGATGMGGGASPSTTGSWEIMFRNLLTSQGLKQELADALLDWLDEDDYQPRGAGGAEDDHYQLQDPSYRAANGFFNDIGELLLVKGFDKKIVTKLQPYVTVLPANDVKINVNTADPVVLSLLTPKPNTALEQEAVQALVAGREEEGYKKPEDFVTIFHNNIAGLGDYPVINYIDVQSRFFTVNSQAEFGRMSLRMKSLLHRRLDEKVVRVVSRRRGLS